MCDCILLSHFRVDGVIIYVQQTVTNEHGYYFWQCCYYIFQWKGFENAIRIKSYKIIMYFHTTSLHLTRLFSLIFNMILVTTIDNHRFFGIHEFYGDFEDENDNQDYVKWRRENEIALKHHANQTCLNYFSVINHHAIYLLNAFAVLCVHIRDHPQQSFFTMALPRDIQTHTYIHNHIARITKNWVINNDIILINNGAQKAMMQMY